MSVLRAVRLISESPGGVSTAPRGYGLYIPYAGKIKCHLLLVTSTCHTYDLTMQI